MFSINARDKHTDAVTSDVYKRTMPSVVGGNKLRTLTNSFYKLNKGAKRKQAMESLCKQTAIKSLRSFKKFLRNLKHYVAFAVFWNQLQFFFVYCLLLIVVIEKN